MFGEKRVEKKKTPIYKCNLNPIFNASFEFDVPWEQIRDCAIDVQVMDFDTIGRNELIGKILLACEFLFQALILKALFPTFKRKCKPSNHEIVGYLFVQQRIEMPPYPYRIFSDLFNCTRSSNYYRLHRLCLATYLGWLHFWKKNINIMNEVNWAER